MSVISRAVFHALRTTALVFPLWICVATSAHHALAQEAASDPDKPQPATEPAESASPPATESSTKDELAAGHSVHGEVFNEGPRQAAYLMPGMGNVSFPVSCNDDLVQRFFNQGVAQLHGFWYYEAERSFRQAATLDPDCAMLYWGMAMANNGNADRARKFIAEAVKRREQASEREQRYIDALEKFLTEKDKEGKQIEKKTRSQQYIRDLERIVQNFPTDIEAKALLVLALWEGERNDVPITSHVAVNALLQQVFDVSPMHPAHHFRIHLWDNQRAEMALHSAAMSGPSLPGIAHMWHMPGHTYSKLHRYQDAVWQQEASARVDHAHMIRDRVMPDQIHNFAHNNEWLIRNLVKIGRVEDAIHLAKNMLDLPRHPKFNTIKKGSAKFGRERLLLVLSSYRLWDLMIEFCHSDYLGPTDNPELQVERLRHLGIAYAFTGKSDLAKEQLTQLNDQLARSKADLERLKEPAKENSNQEGSKEPAKSEQVNAPERSAVSVAAPEKPTEVKPEKETPEQSKADEATIAQEALDKEKAEKEKAEKEKEEKEKAEKERKRIESEREKEKSELESLIKKMEQAIAAIEAVSAATAKDYELALKKFEQAGKWDELLQAEWLAESNAVDKAIEVLDKEIKSNPNEVLPWATKVFIYANSGNHDAAKSALMELRQLACRADLATPMLARVAPLAAELGFSERWAAEYVPATDIGHRPDLDSLGPFRWHPYVAPEIEFQNADGQKVALSHFEGKPTVVFFYLGFGCLHCIEQLHAFSPVATKFRDAGIEMIAISTENLEMLQTGIERNKKAIDIPLHTDATLAAFKAFRCFDDFESKPLHGTFLLDHNHRVVWQDIGYEPFSDVEFLTSEAHRLLEISGFPNTLRHEKVAAEKTATAAK